MLKSASTKVYKRKHNMWNRTNTLKRTDLKSWSVYERCGKKKNMADQTHFYTHVLIVPSNKKLTLLTKNWLTNFQSLWSIWLIERWLIFHPPFFFFFFLEKKTNIDMAIPFSFPISFLKKNISKAHGDQNWVTTHLLVWYCNDRYASLHWHFSIAPISRFRVVCAQDNKGEQWK